MYVSSQRCETDEVCGALGVVVSFQHFDVHTNSRNTTQNFQVWQPSQPTAAVRTNTVPFSLEKTLEVLQCTSHLDLLRRGERGQVNDGMVNRNTYMS